MKINIPAALALLLTAAPLHAGEIASRFLCTDGTVSVQCSPDRGSNRLQF